MNLFEFADQMLTAVDNNFRAMVFEWCGRSADEITDDVLLEASQTKFSATIDSRTVTITAHGPLMCSSSVADVLKDAYTSLKASEAFEVRHGSYYVTFEAK